MRSSQSPRLSAGSRYGRFFPASEASAAELDSTELINPLQRSENFNLSNTALNIHSSPTEIALFDAERKRLSRKSLALASQLLTGIARDFVWAMQTAGDRDFFSGKLNEFWGPTLTQMIGPVPPMLGAFTIMMFIGDAKFELNKKLWLKKQTAFTLASLLSVPVWNGAQILGLSIGSYLALNDTPAKYFAGIFTGIAETILQNAIVIPLVLGEPINKLEMLFNTLAGAVWQWAFTAVCNDDTEDLYNNFETALAVGFSVASATLLMTSLAYRINKPRKPATISVIENGFFSNDLPLTEEENPQARTQASFIL